MHQARLGLPDQMIDPFWERTVTINFAILGAGRIGQVHAQAVAGSENAALRAVADPMPEAADAMCRTPSKS